MRISDWSSDVCSSDLGLPRGGRTLGADAQYGNMVMAVEIAQLPVLSDNYIYLVHDPESRRTAVVDPAVGPPVLVEAARRGWQITAIWKTHWHPDHTAANLQLQEYLKSTRLNSSH